MRFGHEFGDDVAWFRRSRANTLNCSANNPIFSARIATATEWQSVALLGFEQRENLFLRDGRWNAAYLPGAVAKGPFLIGFQEQRIDGELRKEPVIHVDMEHPRVSTSEGEAVFLPQGGNSAYLQHIAGRAAWYPRRRRVQQGDVRCVRVDGG
jgi:hypothetical protein